MTKLNILLPFLPVLVYFIMIAAYFKKLIGTYVDPKRHGVLDLEMNAVLNLVGFSITILCLLLTLTKGTSNIDVTTYHIILSICFFILSFLFYHLRINELLILCAAGFRNAGIWTLISSMAELGHLHSYIYIPLTVLLIVFTIYIIIEIIFLTKN